MLRILSILFFVVGSSCALYSQAKEIDSPIIIDSNTNTQKSLNQFHSANKATLFSLFLPGAGQIYNKKYWKTPIIWGGIFVALSVSQTNRSLYNEYKNEYILELGYPKTQSVYHEYRSLNDLEAQKNYHKKRMETAYIFAGAIYILQILDANVDAHLMSFDVSDDLSFNVLPHAYPNLIAPSPTMGLTLCFDFH